MSEKEVFDKITSELKWYIGYCSQPYASQMISRYESGCMKKETINKLFKFFGYVVKEPTQWVKSSGKPNNLKTK